MLKISEDFINSTAPNQSAINNGLGLVKKNAFVKLGISEDKNFILGECKGSGSSNYTTSADFIKPDNPVFRCSCPSRQFPCKHAIGLMLAFVHDKSFDTIEVPQDIQEKRSKAEKKQEKAEQGDAKPKKTNKAALKKKVAAQLEGLALLEKIVHSITQGGLGTLNAKSLKNLEEQAKQLSGYYLTVPQFLLRDFIFLFKQHDDLEQAYSPAIENLLLLHNLCKKGKEYLNKRLADPELAMDISSNLDELLGHAWQLAELKNLGLVQKDVELVQLKFSSSTSEARKEYIDAGTWINLTSGQIHETFNYRPFKAANYIKEEDSFFAVMQVSELFTYPGAGNNRVRWDAFTIRDIEDEDIKRIKLSGQEKFTEVIKHVKNQIKNPLAGKYPLMLIKYGRIGMVEGHFVMEDGSGQRIILSDCHNGPEPGSTELLELVRPELLENNTALVRFHMNPQTRKLCAQPLTIIADKEIIRLTF